MRKRVFFLTLMVVALIVLLTINVSAAPTNTNGYCGAYGDGSNIKWELDAKGVLTITGKGKMADYYWSPDEDTHKTPWYNNTSIKTVVINEGITNIGDRAFYGCSNLEYISIPESVQTIGDGVFSECSSLTVFEIPENITSIGDYTFYNCSGLTKIVIPESITYIANDMFSGCSSLTEVVIPNSITHIGGDAFANCSNLTSIIIPNSVTSIWSSAFEGCSRLESISLPKWTEVSGWAVFANCSSLRSIKLPCGTTIIDDYFFRGCTNLTSVVIPSTVTEIRDAFYGCDRLADVYFIGSIVQWENIINNSTGRAPLENARIHYINYKDVSMKDYFYDPVVWAAVNGITSGTDASHFSPKATCTRAQMVTFLWRAYGCPKVSEVENPFKDVNPSDYYYDAVMWALKNDITTGTDANHFSPKKSVTRAQTVTFMWRADGEISVESQKNFKDVNPGDYYYKAVMWALGNGITNGIDATHFGPNSGCTRGQIVTFLYRCFC